MSQPPVEVFRFDPLARPAPHSDNVLWVAPGTLPSSEEQLRSLWNEFGRAHVLAKVAGAWGAVLWDAEQSRYLVVTDPLGVQPVFWSQTGSGEVAVASWLAALVDESDVNSDIDYEAILIRGCSLIGGEAVATRTNYRDVRWVPWGRASVFSRTRAHGAMVRYWDPGDIDVVADMSVAAAAELINTTLAAAVGRTLTDRLPVGAHLSGGLDCSAVAVLAQRQLAARGDGIVMGYSWSPSSVALTHVVGDERPRASDVADLIGVPIRWLDESGDGQWYSQRDPLKYPHATTRWESFVLPQARDDGVRVLLSGWGGDELVSFNGRSAVESMIRSGQWRGAWRLTQPWPAPAHQRVPRARRLAAAMRNSLPRFGRGLTPDNPQLREAVALLRIESNYAADLMEEAIQRWLTPSDTRTQQLGLLNDGHLQWRTMGWYQAGRLFDVYYRFPLLDVEVAEAALSFPVTAFMSPDWARFAFRTAMADKLPASVVWHTSKRDPALYHPENPLVPTGRSTNNAADEQLVHVQHIVHRVSMLLNSASGG